MFLQKWPLLRNFILTGKKERIAKFDRFEWDVWRNEKTLESVDQPRPYFCDNILNAPANIWFKVNLEDLLILTENTNDTILLSHEMC